MRRIVLWGYGREGEATHRYLRTHYPDAPITLLNDTAIARPDGIDDLICGSSIADFISTQKWDLFVKSPGVSINRPEFAVMRARALSYTTATNLWFATHGTKNTFVITGSKGKSTSCAMLHHMLRGIGMDVALAGNIGVPLLDTVPGKDGTVIELSSYQLADLDLAYTPTAFIVLNLYPAHISWHGTVERYYHDKTALGSRMRNGLVITNARNSDCVTYLPPDLGTLYFNAGRFYQHGGDLYQGDQALPLTVPLRGGHVRDNLAALCTLIDALGFDAGRALGTLHNFTPLPHRLQEIGTTQGGVLCVNDSIATVPQSTLEATRAYRDQSVHLIFGGQEQGQDFRAFIAELPAFSGSIKGIYCLPESGHRFDQECTQAEVTIPRVICGDLAQAVSQALSQASAGEVLLLSPGAPSYNQFKNFEQRGEIFIELCLSVFS